LIRSTTSVAANYRAANRSRSDREFVSKINIVLEEADECCFWLEIIKEKNWRDVGNLLKEANELTAIFVSILKKMNSKKSLLFNLLPSNFYLLPSNFYLFFKFSNSQIIHYESTTPNRRL
jgi:hypothetical protein